MPTVLKIARVAKPYHGVTRLVAGEAGIKTLTILDSGWLEIVGASTVLRPPSEVLEGVVEGVPVVTPETAHVPEVHQPPVSASEGVRGEGYVTPQPYKAPEPSRKRGKR